MSKLQSAIEVLVSERERIDDAIAILNKLVLTGVGEGGPSGKTHFKISRKSKSLHWTQRPENKERLAKMARKSAKTRARTNGEG